MRNILDMKSQLLNALAVYSYINSRMHLYTDLIDFLTMYDCVC